MIGRYRRMGFVALVHWVHPSNMDYLKRELDALDAAVNALPDGIDQQPFWNAWSALHLGHGLLDRAAKEHRFVRVNRHGARIGRVYSISISLGFRSQGPKRPWRRMAWLQAFGYSVAVPLWEISE